MSTHYFDFETRCKLDLTDVGAYRYVRDPSCSVLLTAWAVDAGPVPVDEGVSKEFLQALADADRIIAHNVGFDRLVLRTLMSVDVTLPLLDCTAARSRAAGLPGALEDVVTALKLNYRKDPRGKFLIRKLCLPQKDGTFLHDPALLAEFKDYARRDVEALRELDGRVPRLCAWERFNFEYDFTLNDRGVGTDRRLLAAMQKLVAAEAQNIDAELSAISDGTITSVGQRDRILKSLNGDGCAVADLRKETVRDLLNGDVALTPKARQILQLRKDGAKSSLAKMAAIEARQVDGRLMGSLLYHGAAPGRHSSVGVQLQNLPRPEREAWMIEMGIADILAGRTEALSTLYGSPMSLLADAMRGLLVPAAGHLLEVCDYNAIELRGAAWVADEQWVLEALKGDKDVYCLTASAIFNRTVTPAMEKERFLGKTLELAAQYGMGVKRFIATCKMLGVIVDEALAQRAITTYRDTHRNIVAFWRVLERAVYQALRQRGLPIAVGRLSLMVEGDWLRIYLPAGRAIHYYRPGIDAQGQLFYQGVNSRTKQFGPIRTWGAALFENVVQGTCRDILMDGCRRVERSGRAVVLLVHDEIVAEVEAAKADVEAMCALLKGPPRWAPGLPLKAKGATLERYRKI